MQDAWIIAMWLSFPVMAVSAYYVMEGMFWCFCWCFCKVDGHLQERHWRRLETNTRKLESVSEAA